MADTESYRREAAARFLQAVRAKVYDLAHRLFPPERANWIIEQTDRRIEEEGQYAEAVDVVCNWFRSENDAQWLDEFWQTAEGSRFLDLSVELNMRAVLREFAPDVPVPPATTLVSLPIQVDAI